MNYIEWVKTDSSGIKEDGVWQLEVYRLSLFLADHCWEDTVAVRKHYH